MRFLAPGVFMLAALTVIMCTLAFFGLVFIAFVIFVVVSYKEEKQKKRQRG